MKTISIICLLIVAGTPALAQQPFSYTIWMDGIINPQLPKSSLYLLGTGVRGEVSKSIGKADNALFAQVGYARFFQKSTSAFRANVGLVTVGYRYQSRRAFTASVGVGAQYWSERMRVRFADYAIDETLNSINPTATVGFGFRIKPRYTVGVDYRGLFRPESGTVVLRNNIALSFGYTL